MKCLKVLKSLVFLLCSICLGSAGVVISKYEKISFISKANRYYRFYKVDIIILIRFCHFLLNYLIISLGGFYPFVAITDIPFSVISKSNVMIDKIFVQ